ncbi:MAG: XRE family transcriptional regulator [Lachnospiraceae bacterium]|nr:XRE family transcriptional regulator [Lachnospiraceae bacterium]
MDKQKKIIELRESTGMNRVQFCEYFQIPYRTVSDWEKDVRHAPDYVLRLLEYYIRMEGLMKKGMGLPEEVQGREEDENGL